MVLPARVLGRGGEKPPSEKLNIAVIGAGGRGADDIEELKSENIVALCDVDDQRAAETRKKFPRARNHRDFRVMLEKEKDIDAITKDAREIARSLRVTSQNLEQIIGGQDKEDISESVKSLMVRVFVAHPIALCGANEST
mgnify:CR=1 FL=1